MDEFTKFVQDVVWIITTDNPDISHIELGQLIDIAISEHFNFN